MPILVEMIVYKRVHVQDGTWARQSDLELII